MNGYFVLPVFTPPMEMVAGRTKDSSSAICSSVTSVGASPSEARVLSCTVSFAEVGLCSAVTYSENLTVYVNASQLSNENIREYSS